MVSVTGLRMAAVAGMATISRASGSVNANANSEKVGRDCPLRGGGGYPPFPLSKIHQKLAQKQCFFWHFSTRKKSVFDNDPPTVPPGEG